MGPADVQLIRRRAAATARRPVVALKPVEGLIMTRLRGLSSRAFACALAVAFALAGGRALAQDTAPPAPDAPAPPEESAPKVDVSGFVDVYYGYNFNKVDPLLRTFDVQHNAFSLSLAEIAFSKAATTDSRVGGRIDLDFGKTADIVASFEPEDNGQEIYKHIQQAYLSVLAGEKVTIDAGKFVTPMGAEVIESQDNWNYTRSILFGYAIPFYHVGVRASVAASDKVSLSGFVLNGWNNGSETNGDKTFAVGATIKPTEKLTWVANFMAGKEGDPDADTLSLFDTTLTLALGDKVSLMGNFDYGTQGDVSWWGTAVYAKLQAGEKWAVVGRYEYIDDTDGGFMTIDGKAQTFTVTSDHLVAGDLKMRLEYRLDKTDDDYFEKDSGSLTKTQSTFTVGLVYGFGGKI
jgi:hypothetical protein